jgi:hypothetical protein
MQTIDLANNELAATTNSATPDSTSTQHSNTAQPGIDPDLLKIIEEVAAEVRKCATYALGWRIRMGVRLREYRDGLDSDDWNLLLESGRLPFSARTAQTLARIGDHKILTDMNRTHLLPDSITVLNEIAALPPSVAAQALVDGTIHPGTTLAQAKTLVAQHRAKKLAATLPRPSIAPL